MIANIQIENTLTNSDEAIEKARGWIGGIKSNKYSKGMFALAEGKSWRTYKQSMVELPMF